MHRIRKALEKYESGDGAFNTVAGLLVKLPDDEDEQERMFAWCHSMGFAQADDTHPVMKLKGPKVILKKEYQRYFLMHLYSLVNCSNRLIDAKEIRVRSCFAPLKHSWGHLLLLLTFPRRQLERMLDPSPQERSSRKKKGVEKNRWICQVLVRPF